MGYRLSEDRWGDAGKPSFFIPSSIEDLIGWIRELNCKGRKFKVVGNGTNLIFANFGNLCLLKLKGKSFEEIREGRSCLEVGAGVEVRQLLRFCIKRGLGGLEFLVGIPGTVGGAIACNAGAFGKEISECVEGVDFIREDGEYTSLRREQIIFSYRNSNLRSGVIVKAYLKVQRSKPEEVRRNLKGYFLRRLKGQDLKGLSWGCFFKNPDGIKIGRLLDELGLKGKRRATAYISSRHANFLILEDGGRLGDILSLKDLIQKAVWLKRRIWIEPEVEILW